MERAAPNAGDASGVAGATGADAGDADDAKEESAAEPLLHERALASQDELVDDDIIVEGTGAQSLCEVLQGGHAGVESQPLSDALQAAIGGWIQGEINAADTDQQEDA